MNGGRGGVVETPFEALVARLDALRAEDARRIIGLTGAPGSGKTTLAEALVARAREPGVLVPMDGFHLANSELARLGRSDRKGAPDTFDGAGYVALLRRLRDQAADEIVYAPEFRREIEEPIACALPVFPSQLLVVTEGNYLLLDEGPWRLVRALVDEVWYVDIDRDLRLERLIARHVRFGRSEAAAREWVARSDERNAEIIAATRSRADLVVRLPVAANASLGR